MSDEQTDGQSRRSARADAWCRRFNIGESSLEGLTESTAEAVSSRSPDDRIALARDRMEEIVMARFGNDPALREAVAAIALSSSEAVQVLAEGAAPSALEQFNALEAVVAFDGTRPSFLIKDGAIDFDSSYSDASSKGTLDPHLDDLADFAACVGRVELAQKHIGTAFLIAPTLALTNRHVAQAIADLEVDPFELLGQAYMDFGREHGGGRATYDRREITRIVLTGAHEIRSIDHAQLDLALLEVAPSALAGAARDRFLPLSNRTGDLPGDWLVGAVGYPGGPREWSKRSRAGPRPMTRPRLTAIRVRRSQRSGPARSRSPGCIMAVAGAASEPIGRTYLAIAARGFASPATSRSAMRSPRTA